VYYKLLLSGIFKDVLKYETGISLAVFIVAGHSENLLVFIITIIREHAVV
jgi:hypothetical protein